MKKENPSLYLWNKARERARATGDDFTITHADIEKIWPADNRCPIFQVELKSSEHIISPDSPTLDRMDVLQGYVPGNIAVLSNRANRLKSDATAAELERVVAWMRSQNLS